MDDRRSLLRVMSFNIRTVTARDYRHAWNLRKHLVVERVRAFDPDLLGLQVRLELIASRGADHVLIVDVTNQLWIDIGFFRALFPNCFGLNNESFFDKTRLLEKGIVVCGVLPPFGCPAIQVFQFDQEHGSLESV